MCLLFSLEDRLCSPCLCWAVREASGSGLGPLSQVQPQLQTQLRPGPARGPSGCHRVGPSCQRDDSATSPQPRGRELSQLPPGLPEGRIPGAPAFMAMFILSRTRGNKPRRRGQKQNELGSNKCFKRWSEPPPLSSYKLFQGRRCFLWCGTLEACDRTRGQPCARGDLLESRPPGRWQN